jgi:hypothetical protein
MNPPSREEALFQVAVALAGADRTAFLDRECAGDPAMRGRRAQRTGCRRCGGQTLIALGKAPEAERVLANTLRQFSGPPGLSAFNCLGTLVESLCLQHRYADAQNVVSEALGRMRAGSGSEGEALRLRVLAAAIEAHSGQWQEAAATFTRLAAADRATPATWRIGVAAALSLADTGQYRELCQQAIWRFGATAEAETAVFLAMGLLLGPADDDTRFALQTDVGRTPPSRRGHRGVRRGAVPARGWTVAWLGSRATHHGPQCGPSAAPRSDKGPPTAGGPHAVTAHAPRSPARRS